MTLVVGPAGSGKTTSVASCFGALASGRVAWLRVDRQNDEPQRLAHLIVEALRRSGAPLGSVGPLGGVELLDAVFEQLMEQGSSWTLVLDDLHELTAPATLEVLEHLLEQAPAALDVIVLARAEPPAGWRRLEVAGRLGQIGWPDLAFSPAEIARLASGHGLRLSAEDALVLWRCTEGWAAGLRLAMDALRSGVALDQLVVDMGSATGAVAAYLLDEVLSRQEPEAQEFLLHTSVAEVLTPALAGVLTADPGGGQRLVDLANHGVFLMPVDGQQNYRYHPLFRGMLQAQLRRRKPGLVADLHRRAASWHRTVGSTHEAEAHATAAGDWGLVGQVVLERWLTEVVDGGSWPTDPLSGIPGDAKLAAPELAVLAATEACRWGRQEEADLYRRALPSTPSPSPCGAGSVWDTARLLCDIAYGWAFGADDNSRAAVACLDALSRSDPSTLRLHHLAALGRAHGAIETGDLDRANRVLDELAEQSDSVWQGALASALLAVVEACSGTLWASESHIAKATSFQGDGAIEPVSTLTSLASGLCIAQRDGLHAMTSALPATAGHPEWSPSWFRALARAVRAAANGAAPFFVSLDETTARHPLAERGLIALGVLEVIDPRGRPVMLGGKGERIVLDARRHLAEGMPQRSEELLVDWVSKPANRHPRTDVEATVLAAIAADFRNDGPLAASRLRSAFDLALATGVMAPLRAHGGYLRGLVQERLDTLGVAAPVALELLDRVPLPGAPDLVEALTDRETEILRRLPALMSNAEIAEALHLSVNTVKTHLKAIYRKLGVGSRRAAVQRGRELDLVGVTPRLPPAMAPYPAGQPVTPAS